MIATLQQLRDAARGLGGLRVQNAGTAGGRAQYALSAPAVVIDGIEVRAELDIAVGDQNDIEEAITAIRQKEEQEEAKAAGPFGLNGE